MGLRRGILRFSTPTAVTFSLDPSFAPLADALRGELELESEIGRGGMGVVFRARDVRLDRSVALKVLPPRLNDDEELRTRFLREARTAGQLSHPNIVHIHRADERAGFAFFVMGLVDGENLGQRVRDRGPLPATDAVRHLREVAWALAYAHARGVIHRDVKPENIMIERGSNRALVTDFGIARVETAAEITGAGQVMGTALYMSPEQVQGTAIDGRSDLYALGLVGFYLLSGRHPFEGLAAGAAMVAHATQTPPSLLSVAPNLPRALAAVIDRCLAKSPAERFDTGEDLAESLRRAVEGAVADRAAVVSDRHRHLSEDQAGLVWRRAAQLQAEAAARLERETRAHAVRTVASTESKDLAPTAKYRLQDVEAAAVEAGISQRFVALALSELPNEKAADLPSEPGSTREAFGRAVLGSVKQSMSVSRVIRAPARDVLRAIGKTFQNHEFKLSLRDQIGPHPLDGGILVFRLPDMDASGAGTKFNWLRYGLYARELRATLRVLEHENNSTEVTLFADLRPGIGMNVWGYTILSGGVTGAATLAGGVIGAKAMALAGALLLGPAAVTAMAAGALAISASRAFYRYEATAATSELEELLLAVEGSLRVHNIFEDEPAALAARIFPADSDSSSRGE